MKKTLLLMILDGWGINKNKGEKNAVEVANPTNFYNLMNEYPHSELEASSEAVGLPHGQMGNSEVGHLSIGSGRTIYQPLLEISRDIKSGEIEKNQVIMEAMAKAKEHNSTLHLGGLVSDGGVHSHMDHIKGLIALAKKQGIANLYVHAFMDGRDTPPTSGINYIKDLESYMAQEKIGKIATISGRYYAMDRDKNWDRVQVAYAAIAEGKGVHASSAVECMENSYKEGKTDEFVVPCVIDEAGILHEGDVFVCFNFRPDRARQITRAINDKDFPYFQRKYLDIKYYCMREYDATIDAPVIYRDSDIKNTLGEVLANNGLTQLRTAETEKYAHVTFFFNGGKEECYAGEDRKLVNSPKVATYDMQPEMSAYEVTDGVVEALDSHKYDVIVLNFANPDMVGHTGVFDAAVAAVKAVDTCIGRIYEALVANEGDMIVIADHGNVEKMEDPETREPLTAHTTNLVPFILVSQKYKNASVMNGNLSDVAPTMLYMLGVDIPQEMTGKVLIKH